MLDKKCADFINSTDPQKHLMDEYNIDLSIPVVGELIKTEYGVCLLENIKFFTQGRGTDGAVKYDIRDFNNPFMPENSSSLPIGKYGFSDRNTEGIRWAKIGIKTSINSKNPLIANLIPDNMPLELFDVEEHFKNERKKFDEEIKLEYEKKEAEFNRLRLGLSTKIKPASAESLTELIQYFEKGEDGSEDNLIYNPDIVERFYLALHAEELIVLCGRPGSGKTSIVTALDQKNAENPNIKCTVIQVQSNWTDQQDLLGYYNSKDDEFIATEFLKALWEAEKDKSDILHIICLDEMNLAPVEYYFASFLSIMQQKPEERKLVLHPHKTVDSGGNLLSFVIPTNVCFVGTLNMDAYGRSLSPKVLSRAMVIEFPAYGEENVESNSIYSGEKTDGFDFNKFWGILEGKIVEFQGKIGVHLLSHRLKKQVERICKVFNDVEGANENALIDYILCSKVLPNLNTQDYNKSISADDFNDYPITQAKLVKMIDNKNKILTFFGE